MNANYFYDRDSILSKAIRFPRIAKNQYFHNWGQSNSLCSGIVQFDGKVSDTKEDGNCAFDYKSCASGTCFLSGFIVSIKYDGMDFVSVRCSTSTCSGYEYFRSCKFNSNTTLGTVYNSKCEINKAIISFLLHSHTYLKVNAFSSIYHVKIIIIIIIIIICDPVNRSQVPKYLVGTIYPGFC